MIHTYTSAPITEIRICERTHQVPRGYEVGAHCPQQAGSYYYIIRKSDGASVLCRATPCEDELLPMSKLKAALDAAMDAPRRGRPELPEGQRADSQIQLRVTRERKAAYVRAAKGATLAAWCFANLDKAAGYSDEQAKS